MSDPLLTELAETIRREIPLSLHLGVEVYACNASGLAMSIPLDQNVNHQGTAFAGSLNALCTLTGWGAVFLLTRKAGIQGDVVIRRSAIRYLRPVTTPRIEARCRPVDGEQMDYFFEMLTSKGQAKLELAVEIRSGEETAVTFHGSYVVRAG